MQYQMSYKTYLKGNKMKKLLLGLMTLTCLSCFASDLTVKVNTDTGTYTVGEEKSNLSAPKIGEMKVDTKKFNAKERQRPDRR